MRSEEVFIDMLEAGLGGSPAALAGIISRTQVLAFANASDRQTGALLRLLAASMPGGRLLEIGTGTGVGTAWLLDGMDATSRLVSIEINPQLQSVAQEFLGCDARLQLLCEDAAEVLARLPEACFDLIFADAIAGKYDHLDRTLTLLKQGGLLVIDDMLPQPTWPQEHAPRVRALLAKLDRYPELIGVGLAWASGLVVLTRR